MKRRGCFGTIWAIILYCVLAAFILAMLPRFGWDIFALIFWCLEKVWSWIITLSEKIGDMKMFQQIFSVFLKF